MKYFRKRVLLQQYNRHYNNLLIQQYTAIIRECGACVGSVDEYDLFICTFAFRELINETRIRLDNVIFTRI